uniref:TLDc domain-containing protein n=1 Tax=Rhizophagus irregularis (strain DAOM 181602 / DAOM 197198 / MUCL 43194) TaxID=747089 RepID=U9SID6_RHIID
MLTYLQIGLIEMGKENLVSASRDGNTATEFHKKCDNRGATIIVLKTKNSERIIGEYNPLEWDPTNGSFKCMKDNFYSHLQIKRMSKWQKVGYSNG